MPTVDADLDLIQKKLRDAGAVWPRTELRRWYLDGYRELLGRSGAVRRLRLLDMPGRHTYGITYEWEDRYASGGTVRKLMRTSQSGTIQTSGLWEVEQAAGLTPSATLAAYTQEWERAILGDSDRHYRFTFPRNHERVVRLQWANRALHAITVRELDDTDADWPSRIGEPRWWSTGVGRIRSVEVHEIETSYLQAYDLRDDEQGVPRGFSGDRAYAIRLVAPPDNAWAYTSQGDAEALREGRAFTPEAAYTHTWEAALFTEAYNFGINLTMNEPAVEVTAVHPWELWPYGVALALDAASPGQRGMYQHERLDPAQQFESRAPASGLPASLPGLGVRVTTAVTVSGVTSFCTQPWEVDQLNGETTLTAGVVRGCFPWEHQVGAAAFSSAVGTIRRVLSPDRQYVGLSSDAEPTSLCGRVSDVRSSDDALLAVEVVTPDVALIEDDIPALLPAPLQKYVRYYVLARAFGRPGEGRHAILADHYDRRFRRGVELMRRLSNVTDKDRQWKRDDVTVRDPRPPRVQLPSTFPRVL